MSAQDLDSGDEARIALGLDYVLQSPNVDLIPAIQRRLESLLSHELWVVSSSTLLP